MPKPTEPKQPLPVSKTLALYWHATMQHRKDAWLSALLPVGNTMLNVFAPFFASKILAGIIVHSPHVWTYFTWFVVTAAVGVVLSIVGVRTSMALLSTTTATLGESVFAALLKRSAGFYNNQIGGKLVSEALEFVGAYNQLFNACFLSGSNFVLTIAIGLTLVLVSNWVMGLIVAVLLGVLVYWTILETRRRSSLRTKRLAISRRLTGHLSDSIVNAVTIKTFAQETQELATNHDLNEELKHAKIVDWQRTVTNENERMALLLLIQMALILSLVFLARRDPHLLAGGIFAFTYTLTLINRFSTVNTLVRQIEESFLQAAPMTAIIGEVPEVLDAPNAAPLKITNGQIVCQNVDFRYADAPNGDYIFQNLNLVIQPGQKVGLVGHSGGGKSTLTRLLLRFEDISGGTIAIDDQNIRTVTQASLRAQISYVPQEPLLFHRSIRENIAYGNTKATQKDIVHAATLAYAHEFISKLPDGYDTIVGERGVKLSGGQRQRIAIARALLKNAPVLVLDEATSALDSESEKLIQKALWELMDGKTAVVIAHRLSTIQKMDRILVLDNGKIVEDGTHRQLLDQNGIYAKLWAHQSGGFIEE